MVGGDRRVGVVGSPLRVGKVAKGEERAADAGHQRSSTFSLLRQLAGDAPPPTSQLSPQPLYYSHPRLHLHSLPLL